MCNTMNDRTNWNPPQLLCPLSPQAAVKAVAWCPWQSGVLASGGGTADRCIRTWNCNTGNLLNTVDTKSQVSSTQSLIINDAISIIM